MSYYSFLFYCDFAIKKLFALFNNTMANIKLILLIVPHFIRNNQ